MSTRVPDWAKPGGGGVFVTDIFEQLGYEPIKEDTWAAGAGARKLWEDEFGHAPHLVRHKKTNSPGSHAMAVYPPWYRDRIVDLVRRIASTHSRQQTFI